MSRIRTIKPEFWGHHKVARISRDARLLFLGLLNESDDEGKLLGSSKRLAGVVFPYDEDVTPKKIDTWLDGLAVVGLIRRYEVDGAPYILILGFKEHQKISHPSLSRLPNPSGDPPETLRPDLGTGNREQGKEEEQGVELALVSAAPTVLAPVDAVFFAWQEATGHRKAVLDPKRRKRIVAALKTHPAEDLIDACRGVMLSPFHCGENDARTVYDDLDVVLRDSAHVEKFRDLARGETHAPPKMPAGTDMAAQWLNRQESDATA